MKTTSIITVENPLGIDQSWAATAPYADKAINLRFDPRGAWREAGGLIPVVSVTEAGLPQPGLSIETLHWWSQHNGARRYLMVEYQLSGQCTLAYWNPSISSGDQLTTVVSGRTTKDGPWSRTQYMANGGWLYFINGYDEPARWDGTKVVRIGFDRGPKPPIVADQNVDFDQEDRTGRAIGLWNPSVNRELDVYVDDQSSPIRGCDVLANQQRGVGTPHSDTFPNPLWRYGYAISYVNDLGQESPLSELVFVSGRNELRRNKRSISVQIEEAPENVSAIRLYRTANLRVSETNYAKETGGVYNYKLDYKDSVLTLLGVQQYQPQNESVNTVNSQEFECFLIETFAAGAGIMYVDDKPDTELRQLFNPQNVGAFPRGAKFIRMMKGTCFLAGCSEYPDRVFYSAPLYVEQFPFRNFLQLGDRDSGEITGMFATDNTLVVFKQRGIYLIQGEPGSFRSVTLTEEIGSSSPNGFAATPMGLMFVSENGVYLLERLDSQAKLTHLSKAIDKVWREQVFVENLVNVQSVVNYKDQEVWIQVPAIGKSQPNLGLCYHYATRTWTLRDGYPVNCFASSHDEYQRLFVGSWTTANSLDGVLLYSPASNALGDLRNVNPQYHTAWLDFGTRYERTMVIHYQPVVIDYGLDAKLLGAWATDHNAISNVGSELVRYLNSEREQLLWSLGVWGQSVYADYRSTILRLDTTAGPAPLQAFESLYALAALSTTASEEGRFALVSYDLEVVPSRSPTQIKKLTPKAV